MEGISWIEKITNEDLRTVKGRRYLSSIIKNKIRRMIGHLLLVATGHFYRE